MAKETQLNQVIIKALSKLAATRYLSESGAIAKRCSPNDLSLLPGIKDDSLSSLKKKIELSKIAIKNWQMLPIPKRAEIMREIAETLRINKKDLAKVITVEVGKIASEAEGEVQEAIDIADHAAGLGRSIYGLVIPSERRHHLLLEQWHPLGIVAVISAFNFPQAVWAWNAMVALMAGNSVIWKPSEKAPLSALAIFSLVDAVLTRHSYKDLIAVAFGDKKIASALTESEEIALVSATGSSEMGRSIANIVSKRFGKVILELGGNNGAIVLADADLKNAVRSIVFGAAGTAGQRCTSLRRLFVERKAAKRIINSLTAAYKQLKIGSPLLAGNLIGPLIDDTAVLSYQEALSQAKKEGAKIIFGGKVLSGYPSPYYVEPTLITVDANCSTAQRETFAPILYIYQFDTLEEAIALNNKQPFGLSSALFTRDIQRGLQFISQFGSDCGIANINIGTSGAEIGGAFGGEKMTGGGRECGPECWKAYMRRQTTTINYSDDLPLAQGVKFEI
jgi:aldehyde dehydrogenase (NAD+)